MGRPISPTEPFDLNIKIIIAILQCSLFGNFDNRKMRNSNNTDSEMVIV